MKGLEKTFLNNLGLLFSTREKVLNSIKSKLFPIINLDKISTRKPATEPAAELAAEPNKHKKSRSKLQQEFIKEFAANEKDINEEIY